MSLDLINQNGVCCALHISYPRFRDRLNPKLWGFAMESDAAKAAFKPPSVRLLVDAMAPIIGAESVARRHFGMSTLSLGPGLVGLRFCPYRGLSGLLSKMKDSEILFETGVDDLITRFSEIVAGVRKQWEVTMAEQTDVPEDLRNEILKCVLSKLTDTPPSREQFGISLVVSQLKTVDAPDVKTLTLAETDAVLEAQAKASEYAKELSGTFVARCRFELQTRLQEFFGGLQGLVESGKPINLRTVRRVREFLDTMKNLNFTNDSSISQLTSGITAAFGPDFSTASSAIRDEDVIQSVRACIDESLKALRSELGTDSMSGGEDRMEAILGATPSSKEESEVVGIAI